MIHFRILLCLVSFLLIGRGVIANSKDHLANPSHIKETVLKNGLRVVLVQHREKPVVSFQMMIKSGIRDAPLGKEGLARATSTFLIRDALTQSGRKVSTVIQQNGGGLRTNTRAFYTFVECDVLSKHSKTALDHFADLILNPAIPHNESDLITKIPYKKIISHSQSLPGLRYSSHMLFGPRYALGRTATEPSLRSITIEDIKTFYRSHFRPNNAVLLCMGSFSEEDLTAQIAEKFGPWKPEEPVEKPDISKSFFRQRRFWFVDYPYREKAEILLFNRVIGRNHPDFHAMKMISHILLDKKSLPKLRIAIAQKVTIKEILSGRRTMIQALDDTYDAGRDFGLFRIHMVLPYPLVYRAYEKMKTAVKKLVDEGITPDELEKAKNYYSFQISRTLEKPGDIADELLKRLYYGLPLGDLKADVDAIQQVTLEDANRIVQENFQFEKLNLMIVGDKKRLEDQLDKIGKYEEIDAKRLSNI